MRKKRFDPQKKGYTGGKGNQEKRKKKKKKSHRQYPMNVKDLDTLELSTPNSKRAQ